MKVSIDSSNFLEKVKQEIRLQAEQLRAATPTTSSSILEPDADDPSPPDFNSRIYSVAELTQFHYRTFLDVAYQAILKRLPDQEGLNVFLGHLALGHGKIAVLGSLRYSTEGRRIGVKVRGLLPRYIHYLLCRLPIVGYVFALLSALLALPKLTRHQNQTDTYFAARFQISKRKLEEQNEALKTSRREFTQQLINLEKITQRLGQLEQLDQLRSPTVVQTQALENRMDEIDEHILSLDKTLQQFTHFEQIKPQLEEHLQAIGGREEEINARIEQIKESLREVVGLHKEEINKRIEQIKETVRVPPEIALLRHDVLATRHWVTSIQNTIGTIEEQERAKRAELDVIVADLANRLANTTYANTPLRTHYLDVLRETNMITAEFPLLDVGSGRGEWLNLVQEHGYSASGVESNAVLAEQCRNAGLSVTTGDLLEHLRRVGTNCLGGISALQAIENFSLRQLVEFLDEAKRSLVTQGVLLIENIDPGISQWNYRGPNSNHLLSPEPLKQLLEARGYKDIQILQPTSLAKNSSCSAFAVIGRAS